MAEIMHSILNAGGDAEQREAVSRPLRRANYAVHESDDADEVLRLAAAPSLLVILHAHLPKLSGLQVCRRIRANPATAAVPVLYLLSGAQPDEDRAALEAADGCLSRPVREADLLSLVQTLIRTRAAAAQFQALIDSLSGPAAGAEESLERELTPMARFALDSLHMPVTARAYGVVPLREHAPDFFEELVRRYAHLLTQAIEERDYQVNHNVSEGLRVLDEQLGFARPGPRDVVEVHNEALKRRRQGERSGKRPVYVEEGRFLILELMGHLVSHYRTYSLGVARGKDAGRTAGAAGKD